MTENISKPFSKELYDRCDKKGKEKVKAYYRKKGIVVTEFENQYDLDLKESKDKFFVEVEVHESWQGRSFPFDTIHIPVRKQKYITGKTLFFILNKEMTNALVIPDSLLNDKDKIEVKNKYIQNGEEFFDVYVCNEDIESIEIEKQGVDKWL